MSLVFVLWRRWVAGLWVIERSYLIGVAMPIRSMFFNGDTGRDIHLIRADSQHNISRSIRDFGLSFVEVLATGKERPILASEYLKNHNDVVLECRPIFRHIDKGTSANLTNFGIDVRRATGIIRVDPGPIAKPFPNNFLLEIIANHRGGAG